MQPGQWSRPPEPLTRGVRPNSPQTSNKHFAAGPGRGCPRPGSRAPRRAAGAARRQFGEDLAVVVPAPFKDRDERHAGLDQPAREQAALADPGPAVAVAEPGVFARQVERLAGGGAGDHLVRLGREPVHPLHRPRSVAPAVEPVEPAEQVPAVVEPVQGQATREGRGSGP